MKKNTVYQTALRHVCLLHNPAHCIGLKVLLLTKQLLLTVAQQEGPNQQVHRSYPTLQDIEAYSRGKYTH